MATMCAYCGTIAIFTRTMQLRLMKQHEIKRWSKEHPGLFERMELRRREVEHPDVSPGSTQ